MGLVFHKLQITESTAGVPNNLSYLEKVFKRYTLKQWFLTGGARASPGGRQAIFRGARALTCSAT